MTLLEELASIVLRIRELKSRIESSEDNNLAWLDQLELVELRRKLERMRRKVEVR